MTNFNELEGNPLFKSLSVEEAGKIDGGGFMEKFLGFIGGAVTMVLVGLGIKQIVD